MATKTDNIEKTLKHAQSLVASLRADLHESTAVSGLLIMPLIQRAADLQRDIQALDEALRADACEALVRP